MRYLFIYRNNTSNKTSNFIANGVQYQDLYITLSVEEHLVDEPEGEYTYALVPFKGSDRYYSAMTFNYEGNLLDTIISCEDGDVKLRDLNPATGLFRIGKEIKETNTYDTGNNKTFYYEG